MNNASFTASFNDILAAYDRTSKYIVFYHMSHLIAGQSPLDLLTLESLHLSAKMNTFARHLIQGLSMSLSLVDSKYRWVATTALARTIKHFGPSLMCSPFPILVRYPSGVFGQTIRCR